MCGGVIEGGSMIMIDRVSSIIMIDIVIMIDLFMRRKRVGLIGEERRVILNIPIHSPSL